LTLAKLVARYRATFQQQNKHDEKERGKVLEV
jgi:hypothetical protein